MPWLMAVLLVSCATPPNPPPDSEGGEQLDRPQAFDRPATADSELARAFEPEQGPLETEKGPGGAPRAAADPSAEARATFAAHAAAAKQLIASRRLQQAASALAELSSAAESMGPAERRQVAQLSFQWAEVSKDAKASRRAAEKWLFSCGPEQVDACRGRALAALASLGRGKGPEAAATREKLSKLRAADSCLRKVEAAARSKARPPACAEGAIGTYRKWGDKLMQARVQLAKGLSALGEGREEEAVTFFSRAEQDCQEPRCLAVRRASLRQLGWLRLRTGQLPAAARAMLSEMRLHATTLPAEQRGYARTKEVEQACAALDAKEGGGSCRRLEENLFGELTFRDFSQENAGPELTAARVREVNEHFSVLLQECLTSEAERLTPPASVTYEVRWMISFQGRVEQVRLGQKDQDSSPLADCLRRQFERWRYPRYQGENQHIEQRFTVNARERRASE